MSHSRFPCAACGLLVFDRPCGSDAACPMCGWIDDFEQLVHPDLVYGANAGVSLRQAQRRARVALEATPGAASQYRRDERWRPLHADETPAADPGGPSSPVCSMGTPDPAGYVPYWRRGGGG
jgi:hypothetical protein